jgi:dipeptide/oligopeptide/nickel ABC superfamily ATP binding cassette transporter permease
MSYLWERLLRRRDFLIVIVLITIWISLAVFAPYLAPYDPYEQDLSMRLTANTMQHLFGTDQLGRDVFSRVLYGGRISLSISLLIVAITAVSGILLGTFSAFLQGAADKVATALLDFFLGMPSLVISIALIGILGPDIPNLILSLCFTHWAEYARVTRTLVQSEREKPYIRYAVFGGASLAGIVFYHLLPNIVPRLLVLIFQNIGEILLTVAGLSLIGIGVPMPYPEWGTMLMGARDYLQTAPRLMLYPGAAIFFTILLFNFLGDILRDVMDPAGGDV